MVAQITQEIPSLGAVPQTSDPDNFDTRSDTLLADDLPAMVAAENVFATQANALATEVNANALTASSAASVAMAASDAELWVSGQSYVLGEPAISTVNFQAYRANTATSGTTDPSLSGDWTIVTVGAPPGGSKIYISTVTASASSTVNIEGFDSTYERYVIECDDLLLASFGELRGQVKISGSYVTTSTYYSHRSNLTSASGLYSGNAISAGANMHIGGIYDPAGKGSLYVEISSPSGSSSPKPVFSRGVGITGSTVTYLNEAGGANSGTGAVTALRIFENTGITITGTFKLYGIKNS